MTPNRFKPGTYVLFEDRRGVTHYWRGTIDGLNRPRDSANIMIARLFVSARHCYRAAGEHRALRFWRARWIGPPGYKPGPDWDAHFADRLMRKLFKITEVAR